MGGDPTYVEGATEGTGCLRAKLERAIDCMRLIASRTKFAHSLALSLLRVTPGIQTTSPFCCASRPALKSWCVTLATATQTTTYARPSPGPSVVGERCSHRSLPSFSVAALCGALR